MRWETTNMNSSVKKNTSNTGQVFESEEETDEEACEIQTVGVGEGNSDNEGAEGRVRIRGRRADSRPLQDSDRPDSRTRVEEQTIAAPPESETPISDAIERLIPELRQYARSLCKDAVLADDLVQEACLKAWSAREAFRPGSAARPWLFRILRNEYYQIKRRSWRNIEYDEDKAESSLVALTDLEAAFDLKVLKHLIAQLPKGQYEALLLVVAAGFTHDEASEICGCSAGTIKSRVSRGREALRELYDTNDLKGWVQLVSNEPCSLTAMISDISDIVAKSRLKAA